MAFGREWRPAPLLLKIIVIKGTSGTWAFTFFHESNNVKDLVEFKAISEIPEDEIEVVIYYQGLS